MTELLPTVQMRVLVELGTYFYLSVDMMHRLGVGKDIKNLRQAVAALCRKGLITRPKTPPKGAAHLGSLPYLHNLLEPGAQALASILGEPPQDVKTDPYRGTVQLEHLIWIIETHIALRQWAATSRISVEWFRGEYQPGPEIGRKATTIIYPAIRQHRFAPKPWYTPDAMAEVIPADGKPRLLVIEVYRGGFRHDLDHFRKKLPILRHVCHEQAVEKAIGAGRGARFLIVFANQAMRDQALAEWPDPKAELWQQFFVKHMGELTDFGASWQQPGRPPRGLF